MLKVVDARRDDEQVDEYHGTKISDPYHWMEDPDSDETKAFVDAQNNISRPYLDSCPVRDKLNKRLTELWDFPKYSCPYKRGDHYYYSYNSGLQNQSVVYVQDSLESEARVFLDPNLLSDDGTVSLNGKAFSENGKYLAYGISKSGSDWITIKFKEAPSGKDLPDTLEKVKFSSMAWTHDHKGLFYNKYLDENIKAKGTETASNQNQKLFYHRIGTDQSEDVLVAEFPDNPKWMIGAEVSDCGRYVILTPTEGCDPTNRFFYVDLHTLPDGINGILPYVKVVDNFDAQYEYLTNEGTLFTLKTNLKAPNYKLIQIDISKPEMENWTTLVEEASSVLEWTACVNNNKLVMCYLEDVKNKLYVYNLSDGKRMAEFPLQIGTIAGYTGRKEQTEIFFQFISFLTPGVIYRCDMTKDAYTPTVFRETKLKNFDFDQYETKQIFYPSKDGTKIPMFIVKKKDMPLDGDNPCLLYGYGGFNISISPHFSVSRMVFMQHLGGVFALANIRGGGEYGDDWHKGGRFGNKQNVFDDFQAAAQYLIDNKYTSAKKLIINGGSNGGLLVGACMNQRPDLFGCGIAQVGVMDMLKFHKFTIGHAWTTDYGCSDKEDQFPYLIKYSPLHNIRVPEGDIQYPAVLLLTGDHDDRVVPSHSLKFMAQLHHTLKDCKKQTNPIMIRVDTKAGHGSGKPTAKTIEELTDIYSFILLTVGATWRDGKAPKL